MHFVYFLRLVPTENYGLTVLLGILIASPNVALPRTLAVGPLTNILRALSCPATLLILSLKESQLICK